MAKRRKPWWGAGPYEDFRQKVVQRFRRFNLDAENHVIGRNAALAQALGYMSLLYNAGKIPPGTRLVPNQEGARWQSTGGSLGKAMISSMPSATSRCGHKRKPP